MKVFLNEVSGAMEKHVRGGGYLKHAGNRVREEPQEKSMQNKARKGVVTSPWMSMIWNSTSSQLANDEIRS